ncbi:hypothetical protein [Armatimonas sp.]|uniref:hypothetical protein n=1 Tax=Armatimonas sp. TaxID=1872638 RepID=UPI0037523891
MAESRNSPGSESSGLNLRKFNSTSVTTTTEVITPKLSSALMGRRVILIGVVLLALGAVAAITFQSSRFNPFDQGPHGPGLVKPEPTLPQ